MYYIYICQNISKNIQNLTVNNAWPRGIKICWPLAWAWFGFSCVSVSFLNLPISKSLPDKQNWAVMLVDLGSHVS